MVVYLAKHLVSHAMESMCTIIGDNFLPHVHQWPMIPGFLRDILGVTHWNMLWNAVTRENWRAAYGGPVEAVVATMAGSYLEDA